MAQSKPLVKRLPTRTAKDEKTRPAEDNSSQPSPKRAKVSAEEKTKPKAGRPSAAATKAKAKPFHNARPSTRLNIFVFGDGESSELGLGAGPNSTLVGFPRFNPLLDPEKVGVVSLACGGMHVAALTHDNKVLTWGINDDNLLLRDTTWDGGLRDVDAEASDSEDESNLNPKESTPTAIPAANLPPDVQIAQVAAGDSATFILTEDGLVYGWGFFRDDQGAAMFTIHPQTHQKIDKQKELIQIKGLKNITSLSAGPDFVLALDAKGVVYGWGFGLQGQLGRRIFARRVLDGLTPAPVSFPKKSIKIRSIHAGNNHAFAIDTNGDTWAWGLNNFAQTGITDGAGEAGNVLTVPQKVTSLAGKDMKMISAGNHHSVAVTNDGQCLAWGRMDGGQVGVDVSTLDINNEELVILERGKPRVLLQPAAVPVPQCAYAASGPEHNVAITAEGKGYSWGFNGTRQLGQGSEEDDIWVAKLMNGKNVREEKLVWAGAGGQYAMVASEFTGAKRPTVNGTK